MTKKAYDWKNGAELGEHTRKKHEVIRRYLRQYLITRCQIPQQERFRLVVVDGFAGGGLYVDGSHGSPLIFIDELAKTTNEINAKREISGMRPISVEALLLLNDADPAVIGQLKLAVNEFSKNVQDNSTCLSLAIEYSSDKFEVLYPNVVTRINAAKCRNVIFNLDQCGYSAVTAYAISDIVSRWRSAEIFLTFAIETLLAFLSRNKSNLSLAFDAELKARIETLSRNSEQLLTTQDWLGQAERIVFSHFRQCAPYVSPFSINNPDGWRYWLMHFANSHRARQVYNDILHSDNAVQAHFGRPGLNMLSYDPRNEGQIYLFDDDSRDRAKGALINEVPTLIAESGDAMSMGDFYATAYRATPAHTDDIHEVMIANPDIEVITEAGGARRQPGTIRPSDTLKLKSQRSLFQMFPNDQLIFKREK